MLYGVSALNAIGRALPVHFLRHLALEVRRLVERGAGTSGAGARASQRNRRAAFGGVTTVLGHAVKILGSLATVPLVLHSLGTERFAVWVTLTSLAALASLGDLGIGNGLINAISTAHGTDDRTAARTYVSSAFFIALTFSSILSVVLIGLDAVVPWPTVFNLTSATAIAEVGPSVKVLIACIVLNVPLIVLLKIRNGYQEVYVVSLWYTVGVILGLGALVAAVWVGASLPWLIFAETGVPIIAMLGNLASLFLVERPWLRPTLNSVKVGAIRKLLDLGLFFFVMNLAGIAAFYSDNILAIWACGPEAAALYAIAVKLFSPCRLLAGTLLTPLWPAYGEAIARGDLAWVRRTVMVSIIVAELVVLPVALVGLFFGNDLVSLWLQRPIAFGYWLLSGMALWISLETIGSGLSIFLNGASAVRVQVPLCVAFALVAVAAKITLAKQFGIEGIIWGTILAYVCTTLLPYCRLIPREMRKLTRGAEPTIFNATSSPEAAGHRWANDGRVPRSDYERKEIKC
jgi:O-antigen/teichoic acid export membrane protein